MNASQNLANTIPFTVKILSTFSSVIRAELRSYEQDLKWMYNGHPMITNTFVRFATQKNSHKKLV